MIAVARHLLHLQSDHMVQETDPSNTTYDEEPTTEVCLQCLREVRDCAPCPHRERRCGR